MEWKISNLSKNENLDSNVGIKQVEVKLENIRQAGLYFVMTFCLDSVITVSVCPALRYIKQKQNAKAVLADLHSLL